MIRLRRYRDPDDPGISVGGVSGDDVESALTVANERLAATADQLVAVQPDGELRFARRGPDGRYVAFDPRPATAQALDLLPHPEGGWFRRTWTTPHQARPAGYPGPRPTATAIHFLLAAGERSRWHVVRSDELWLWHRGGPLTLHLGGTGDRPAPHQAVRLGAALDAGEAPQAVVIGGTWQAAAPASAAEVLVSCVVSPGFDFADVQWGDFPRQVTST